MRAVAFVCVALLLVSFAFGQTTTQASLSSLQAQLASANDQLLRAKSAFNQRIQSDPDYQSGLKKLEKANEDITKEKPMSEARAKAVKNKAAVQAELDALALRLEESDQDIATANARVGSLTQSIKDATAAELRKVQQDQEARRAEYMSIINGNNVAKVGEQVPVVGDETSLALVKAKPKNYIDKPVIVCGAIAISDYYNYGYTDSRDSHYSFSFVVQGAEGAKGFPVSLYQSRSMGDDLVTCLAAIDKVKPNGHLPVRVKMTISSKYNESYDDIHEMFEVLDWQFYNFKDRRWTAWHSEVSPATKPAASPLNPPPPIKR